MDFGFSEMLEAFLNRSRLKNKSFKQMEYKLNKMTGLGLNHRESKFRERMSVKKEGVGRKDNTGNPAIQLLLNERDAYKVKDKDQQTYISSKLNRRKKIKKGGLSNSNLFLNKIQQRKGSLFSKISRKDPPKKVQKNFERFTIENRFKVLKEVFKKLVKAVKIIIRDKSRIQNAFLPQNTHVSLDEFKKFYEKKFTSMFSFTSLKRILAIWDRFLAVRAKEKGLNNTELSDYYINLSESTLRQSRTKDLLQLFDSKVYEHIKTYHDKYIFENKRLFDYNKAKDWVQGFDQEKIYDSLDYYFDAVKDSPELINLTQPDRPEEQDKTFKTQEVKYNQLRDKIIGDIKQKEKNKEDSHKIQPSMKLKIDMMLEIAENLFYMFKLKKVNNLYLFTIEQALKEKINLKYYHDGHEISAFLKELILICSDWIKLNKHRTGEIIRKHNDLDMPAVTKLINQYYTKKD